MFLGHYNNMSCSEKVQVKIWISTKTLASLKWCYFFIEKVINSMFLRQE